MTVRLRDGIEIELSDGTEIVCDADRPAGDVAIVSHAHGDHLPREEVTAICSPATADLATIRRETPLHATTDPRVELRPAGHVTGSRAALIHDPDGTTYCYTGDVCTRDRRHLSGFEPPGADVLIIEATYGTPGYEFPPYESVTAEIIEWLQETSNPVILFGYALGRAQSLQRLAMQAGRDRIFVTDAVARVNRIVAEYTDMKFAVQQFDAQTTLADGDAVVLPFQSTRIDWIDRLVDANSATTAGFSGWAIEESFRYRGDYDVTFPLSDHCDFSELLEVVTTVDPEQVYTTHGAAESLARELTSRGYQARELQAGQTALEDF